MTSGIAFLELGLIGAAVCAADGLGTGLASGGVEGAAFAVARAAALAGCCVLASYYHELYDLRAVRSFRAFLSRLPGTGALALLFAAVLCAVVPEARPRLDRIGVAIGAAVAIELAFRFALYAIRAAGASRIFGRRTVVLGDGTLATRIASELSARPDSGDLLLGLIAPAPGGPAAIADVPVLGSMDRLESLMERTSPDRIVVALDGGPEGLPARRLIAARVRGILVEDGVEVFERLTGKIPIESLHPEALVFSRDFSRSRLHEPIARLMSVVAAAAGLLLSAPVMLLIAAVVRLDSRGPLLFRQDRVGLGGRRFTLLKFRTMRPAPGATSEWAGDNGARITRAGRWLRRFRLDELPQLVNVLRGDMNLIGPRPHPVSNYDLFLRTVPYYWIRAMVRPGITGWAQVRYGYADNLEQETEKMRYDLHYIKHRSPALDLRILLDTVRVVLFAGAATERRTAPVATTMKPRPPSGTFPCAAETVPRSQGRFV